MGSTEPAWDEQTHFLGTHAVFLHPAHGPVQEYVKEGITLQETGSTYTAFSEHSGTNLGINTKNIVPRNHDTPGN